MLVWYLLLSKDSTTFSMLDSINETITTIKE